MYSGIMNVVVCEFIICTDGCHCKEGKGNESALSAIKATDYCLSCDHWQGVYTADNFLFLKTGSSNLVF